MKKILLLLAIIYSTITSAQTVSGKKISELPAVTGAALDSALIPVVENSTTKKARGYMLGNLQSVSAGCIDSIFQWSGSTKQLKFIVYNNDGLKVGGSVSVTDSTSYQVDSATYILNCLKLNSPTTVLTLPANTDTFPRRDIIYLNASGAAGYKLGTPAQNPQTPSLIPGQELGLVEIYFQALADSGSIRVYNYTYIGVGVDSNALHTVTKIDSFTLIFCRPSGDCDTARFDQIPQQNLATTDLTQANEDRFYNVNKRTLQFSNFKYFNWFSNDDFGDYSFAEVDTAQTHIGTFGSSANRTNRLRLTRTLSELSNTNQTNSKVGQFINDGDSTYSGRLNGSNTYRWILSEDALRYRRASIGGTPAYVFDVPVWLTGHDTAATKKDVRTAVAAVGSTTQSTDIAPYADNDKFMVEASGVIRATASGANNPITWAFLDTSDLSHARVYFDSIKGVGNAIRLYYPRAKYVSTFSITPDETLASGGVVAGGSIGTDSCSLFAYIPKNNGGRLTGNTTSWTATSLTSSGLNYNTTTGLTIFSPTVAFGTIYAGSPEVEGTQIIYVGNKNRRVRRTYSGLSGQQIGFYLVDSTNTIVTGNIDSGDIVTILVGRPTMTAIPAESTNSTGYPSDLYTVAANYWVRGVFERYIIGYPLNDTTIKLEWQTAKQGSGNYATNYRITRATMASPNVETEIFNGYNFTVTNTGLTPGTRYIFRMYATILGVESLISNCKATPVATL